MLSFKHGSFLALFAAQVLCQGIITIDFPAGGEDFAVGDYIQVAWVYTNEGSYPFTIDLVQELSGNSSVVLSATWNTTTSAPASYSDSVMNQVPLRVGTSLPIVDNKATQYYVSVSSGSDTANSNTFTFSPNSTCPTYWFANGRTVQGVLLQKQGCSLAAAGETLAWGALAAEPKSIAQISGLVGMIGLAIAYLL